MKTNQREPRDAGRTHVQKLGQEGEGVGPVVLAQEHLEHNGKLHRRSLICCAVGKPNLATCPGSDVSDVSDVPDVSAVSDVSDVSVTLSSDGA